VSPRPVNASNEAIAALLRAGHSNSHIARDLRVDKGRVRRIRAALNLPMFVPVEQTRTIEEKWALDTRPLDGGHLEWTGERATSGTPLVSYKEKHHSAAAVAFGIRTGREPQGYVIADCGMHHCVAPEHVEDEAGRLRNREQLRYLTGGRERKPFCGHGHDQAEHGRYEQDGTAYCEACKRDQKRDRREAAA
jgi:hypothetical protein